MLPGCSALNNSAGKLLKAPYELIEGMTKAMGRTVGVVSDSRSQDNPAPADEIFRGEQITARGDYRGLAGRETSECSPAKSVASR